jgi:hypothetical protein
LDDKEAVMRLGHERLLRFALITLVASLAGTGCEGSSKLRITGIDPNSGPVTGGTLVTVHGNGFQAGGVKGVRVYFGGKEATRVVIEGDDKMKVEPPAGEPGQTVDLLFLFDDARKLEYPKAFTYKDFPGRGVEPDAPPDDKPASPPAEPAAPPATP